VPISGNKQMPSIGVNGFPVREYDGFIWIWMGDPERASSTPLPDVTYLRVTPHLELLRMYMRQESNFQLGVDNLMDPSHTAFLHRKTLSQDTDFFRDLFVRGNYACESMEGGRINSQWSFVDANGVHDIDEKFEAIWIAPSTILQRSRAAVMGLRPKHESYTHFLHLLTPETEHSTHYFALDTYDRRETDEANLKQREAFLKEIVFLAEDDPILADIDREMNGADLFSLKPVILPADAAAIRVRRRYAKMLKEEVEQREVERTEV
jgi:vanillate O-demethylase monooxygenase subunit